MVQIDLVSERDATGEIKSIYEDIKQSLEIPWTPAIFQAFAMYPPFLQFVWNQIKHSVLTEQFHADSGRARGFASSYASAMHQTNYKHEDALANWPGFLRLAWEDLKIETKWRVPESPKRILRMLRIYWRYRAASMRRRISSGFLLNT